MTIGVVIPALNEEEAIAAGMRAGARAAGAEHEVRPSLAERGEEILDLPRVLAAVTIEEDHHVHGGAQGRHPPGTGGPVPRPLLPDHPGARGLGHLGGPIG